MLYAMAKCITLYLHIHFVIVVETCIGTSVKNVKLNINVNIFQQIQMGVAGPCWDDTRICKRSQIYAVRDHTYIYIL